MKKVLLLTLILFFIVSLKAQNAERNNEIERIKESGSFFYASGPVCNSDRKAKDKALQNLYSNITDNIRISLIDLGYEDVEEYINKIYLTLGIDEAKKILPMERNVKDDEYSYFTYIAKDDFDSICDARADMMRYYANQAHRNIKEEDVVEALRSYYWAMMLCVAHPQGAGLILEIDDDEYPAFSYLRDNVCETLGMFDFAIAKDNPGEYNDEGLSVILNVRAFGKDVSGLKIEYYNGVDDYVEFFVKNGKAKLQLASEDVEEIDVMIRYDFLHNLIAYPEIAKVINNIDEIVLKENVRRSINVKDYLRYIPNSEDIIVGESEASFSDLNDNERYLLDMMQKLESAFRSRNYLSVRKYFTGEAFSMLDTIVKNGKMSVVGKQKYEFITLGNVTICRDIDLSFKYRNNASFVRELVFRYDNEKKLISSIAFRLSTEAEHDIMNKGKWPLDCRYALVNFMEDYQSAYDLKRYDYLESIFSDDALIIVGHVVKKTVLSDQMSFALPEDEVRLMEYDKKTYFDNLSQVFRSQEYININFKETDFQRQLFSAKDSDAGGEDIYGVRLLQEYSSTTYGDTGYLFLMVDLRDQKRPLIHVRAWQPDKVNMNKLVGLDDLE